VEDSLPGTTGTTKTVKGNIFSAYGVLNVPNTKVALIGRVDIQKPDVDGSNNRQTRFIAGASYQINPNLRALADVDNLTLQSGVYTNAVESTRTQGLFQIQFVF
jgi:hypothetical protein